MSLKSHSVDVDVNVERGFSHTLMLTLCCVLSSIVFLYMIWYYVRSFGFVLVDMCRCDVLCVIVITVVVVVVVVVVIIVCISCFFLCCSNVVDIGNHWGIKYDNILYTDEAEIMCVRERVRLTEIMSKRENDLGLCKWFPKSIKSMLNNE